MDDGLIFWPLKLNFEKFLKCLNNMHPSIKLTHEKTKIILKSTGFKVLRSKNNLTRIQLNLN